MKDKEKFYDQISKNFEYYPPSEKQISNYKLIRKTAKGFGILLVDNCPPSRELSLALTHLEQVVMWANASIARNAEPESND